MEFKFELKKLVNDNGVFSFITVEFFENVSYEYVKSLLLERFGKCSVRNNSIESPNTWFKPFNSDEEYILTCLVESY